MNEELETYGSVANRVRTLRSSLAKEMTNAGLSFDTRLFLAMCFNSLTEKLVQDSINQEDNSETDMDNIIRDTSSLVIRLNGGSEQDLATFLGLIKENSFKGFINALKLCEVA